MLRIRLFLSLPRQLVKEADTSLTYSRLHPRTQPSTEEEAGAGLKRWSRAHQAPSQARGSDGLALDVQALGSKPHTGNLGGARESF